MCVFGSGDLVGGLHPKTWGRGSEQEPAHTANRCKGDAVGRKASSVLAREQTKADYQKQKSPARSPGQPGEEKEQEWGSLCWDPREVFPMGDSHLRL